MKKAILFALAALAIAAWSCKPEEPPVEDKIEFTAGNSFHVPVEGGVASIEISSTVPWTAETDASWLTLSPKQGESGKAVVKASATKNEATDSRKGTVKFTAGSVTAEVVIEQGQSNAISIGTTEYTVPAEGGTVEVAVSANIGYEVTIPEAVDWVHVVSTKGMVDSKVTLNVDPTYDYDLEHLWDEGYSETIVRSAVITIGGEGASQKVTIGQNPFLPYYDMILPEGVGQFSGFGDGSPLILGKDETSYTIEVSTNLEHYCYFAPWDSTIGAAVETNDVGWIKFTYDESHIYFTLEPNDTFLPREEYFYSGCMVGDIDFGAFGSCVLIRQEGKIPEAGANLVWTEQLSSVNIPSAYNRLAFTASGALLVSDGADIHAINPANGEYWKKITPAVTPTSIASDDAGNIVIAPDIPFSSGSEYDIYWTDDINVAPKVLIHHTADFDGTLGSIRVRGNLAERAVVTGIVTGNRYWAGWEIDKYEISMDNYYAQATGGQARGPLAVDADTWSPESGAVMSLGPRLNEGIVSRAYDTDWRLRFLADAYTPNWLTPYNWQVISDAGAGAGNENQCNMDIVDYNGHRYIAYTQGIWFSWGGNSDVYILDVSNPANTTVVAIFDGSQLSQPEAINADAPYADVLFHEEDGELMLYVVNSAYQSLSKLWVKF